MRCRPARVAENNLWIAAEPWDSSRVFHWQCAFTWVRGWQRYTAIWAKTMNARHASDGGVELLLWDPGGRDKTTDPVRNHGE